MATTKVIPGVLDLNEATSESGLKIPTGTNNNRPATDVAGMIRNNTNETSDGSASCEEYYNGTAWQKINNVVIPPPLAFKTIIYSGNGSTQSLTGLGFQPDLVWIKNRNGTNPNGLWDSTRGAGKLLVSDTNAAETGNAGDLMGSFDADGFQVNRQYLTNTAYDNTNWGAGTYVAWCLKANGGTTSSNTDGSVTSTVQANQDAGFSIVKWDGTGAINTVGHGLSAAPELILIKPLDQASDWQVYSEPTGNGNKLGLNTSAAASSSTRWDSTSPTATVFTLRDIGLGTGQIAYCFHSVSDFSKIGSYSGTGVNGNNITVGFEPNWLMVKRTNATDNWVIVDSERGTNNSLFPDLNSNELSNSGAVTFTSTGFTVNGASGGWNNGSSTYLYMALKTN